MTKTYTCLLIDDDAFSRETLEDIIDDISELNILKSISESGMAIKHIATLQPDIVFLDINMPKKSGIDIQNEIADLQLDTKVIFITSHEKYVVEAFKNKAFDYLVKPVSKVELNETLKRLFEQNNNTNGQESVKNEVKSNNTQDEIIIKNAYGTLILNNNDLVYIEADGAYTNIYLVNGKVEVISKNIGKIEHLFQEKHFFKISRSYIINLQFLSKTDRLKRIVTLIFNNKNIQLKASRDRLYDLEHIIQ
ncbi:MAG: LytTR family DNA-binding domain-containing protein [Bacteroidota bacterium]